MHRSVQCLTNEDQPSHFCPADLKPEERKTCHSTYNCKWAARSRLGARCEIRNLLERECPLCYRALVGAVSLPLHEHILEPHSSVFCISCFPGELPQNCKEAKKLNGASEDGEYFLVVKGRLLKVGTRLSPDLPRVFRVRGAGSRHPVSEPPSPCSLWSALQVFCAGMQSDHPKEYMTLVHGDSENFSEVYGYR